MERSQAISLIKGIGVSVKRDRLLRAIVWGPMTKSKILLIEDDENFVNTVRLVPRSHSVDLVWAKTGAEGIQAYRRYLHGFASVIIDYCLPDLKGSDIALTLRKLNSAQDFLFANGHRDPDS